MHPSCIEVASTGKYEAFELRDGGRRYLGEDVLKAVNNVNNVIAKKVIGQDCTKQKEVDELMIELDGTPNKSNLGANAILAVSMAVCKAGASKSNLTLYEYIAELADSKGVTTHSTDERDQRWNARGHKK